MSIVNTNARSQVPFCCLYRANISGVVLDSYNMLNIYSLVKFQHSQESGSIMSGFLCHFLAGLSTLRLLNRKWGDMIWSAAMK